MPLAERGCAVTVLFECFCYTGRIFRQYAVITRVTGGQFHNNARMNGMVIASGQQSRTRGRTQRRRVETVVA